MVKWATKRAFCVGATPSALFERFLFRSGWQCWKGEELQPPLAEEATEFCTRMQAVFARWLADEQIDANRDRL
ncbi:hypothetical protein CIT26_30255 [Mesorhizobium temperatum]|uniref:Uncharacterized protein n=1 Tax=Mesorhizobium temperatum TaxID=241416 RepID=A0A271LBD1_9HYPH|nr:hypothetical protein CIT26_30255 [Mesorhizobium temperatum]